MRDALLAWCSEYGLLGVLLHRLETVVLPPRASESMMGPGVMTPKYIRTATGWKQDAPVLFEFSDAEKSMEPPEPPDTPGIFLRKEPGDFEISFESLETVRSQFFPDLPTSQDLPLPFSDEFWAHYAEPVHLFLNAATRLREATDGARMKASKADPGNMRVATGVAKLQALAAPVRTTLYKTQRGKFSVGWVCHSLLAAFAMMATLDLAEARLLRCARPDCGKYFVSKAKKARYCTDTCRKTVQMRRWRHRKEVEKRKESEMAGQIINRGDRTWLVRVYEGCDQTTGKRKYSNKTIHGTKKQAQNYLNDRLRGRTAFLMTPVKCSRANCSMRSCSTTR